jgi:hypothetical protein
MNENLAYLVGKEYAEEFFLMTGRYPKYVPSEGIWDGKGCNRKWIVW